MKLLRNVTEIVVDIAIISVAVTVINQTIPREVKRNARYKLDAVMNAIKEQEEKIRDNK